MITPLNNFCQQQDMNTKRQSIMRKVVETHRANIQRSLQHRLEVARAKGDEGLIRQLEAEVDYYS